MLPERAAGYGWVARSFHWQVAALLVSVAAFGWAAGCRGAARHSRSLLPCPLCHWHRGPVQTMRSIVARKSLRVRSAICGSVENAATTTRLESPLG